MDSKNALKYTETETGSDGNCLYSSLVYLANLSKRKDKRNKSWTIESLRRSCVKWMNVPLTIDDKDPEMEARLNMANSIKVCVDIDGSPIEETLKRMKEIYKSNSSMKEADPETILRLFADVHRENHYWADVYNIIVAAWVLGVKIRVYRADKSERVFKSLQKDPYGNRRAETTFFIHHVRLQNGDEGIHFRPIYAKK